MPVCVSVVRAFAGWELPQSKHTHPWVPMQQLCVPWSGDTSESHGVAHRKHCQLMCLLWHSVGAQTPSCPRRVRGGLHETAGPVPLAWGNLAAHLQPGLQQHPPARHGDFSCKELFLSLKKNACKKGGSKDLSSSRWIATHLFNQLIKYNEYAALGKPSERPQSPLHWISLVVLS